MYDVTVIGGGVVGCAILRLLSHTDLKVLMTEKEDDVSCGCSRANSGIVHAGYDAEPGTLKALFNVRGSEMFRGLCEELHVPYKNTGSLVLADEKGLSGLEELKRRGEINGVKGLEIVSEGRLHELEPNVAEGIKWALYAPSAGVVSPYGLTIALAEQAVLNGAEIALDAEVIGIERKDGKYEIKVADGRVFETKVIINAAGYGSAEINRLAGEKEYVLEFRKGDYYLFDSTESRKFRHTCFPLPDKNGKGILVSPTADGNVIAGPTGTSVERGTDVYVSSQSLEEIRRKTALMVKGLDFRKVIRVFAGVRCICGDDFVIELGKDKHFITITGICSPGLTASPAIAEYAVKELLPETGLKYNVKAEYKVLPERTDTSEMTEEEWSEIAERDPAFATVVCRCEKVTEGEILEALRRPLPPRSVDALKRRVRTGMGRCQGGFCTPRIMHILADFYKVPIEKISKKGKDSEIVADRIQSGGIVTEIIEEKK